MCSRSPAGRFISSSIRFHKYRRPHALTLGEVVVIFAAAAVLVGVFLLMQPQMRGRRYGISPGTICASNLGQLGRALYTYGNENRDLWPIVEHAKATEDGLGRVTYAPGMIGVKRMGIAGQPSRPSDTRPSDGGSTAADTRLSTTRNLWVLVRSGAATPGSFICPSDDSAQKNDEDNPQDYYDFRKYSEISYGYLVPYGKKGLPSSDLDQRMPVVADKGPFGAALEAGKSHPGIPSLLMSAGPDEWMKWNSPNHASEGQTVLYADAHAEFQTRPTAGIKNDNIYTRWSGAEAFLDANERGRVQGVPPTGRETPWSDTDTLIYP